MSSQAAKPRLTRAFYALWPDDRVRQQLDACFRHSPYYTTETGHRYAPQNLHLTLHFLGNLDDYQLSCMRQQATMLTAPGFDLEISQFGCFKRAGVLWLAPEVAPHALRQLHDVLGKRLETCDYIPDNRPFRPHITLQRKFRKSIVDYHIEPIHWHVTEFALVVSNARQGGVVYEIDSRYPLLE